MTDLEFLKFVLYGDKYYESIMREDDESESATSTGKGDDSGAPVSDSDDSSEAESSQDNAEAEVADSGVPDPSSNAEINKRIDNMVTDYISNMNQQVSKGFKMRTKDSSGREITARTNISIVPLGGSKPVLDQQNKTLKFKVKINKDSSAETGASKFFRGANAILGAVPAGDSSTWLTK